jgi:hypothetical protein
VPIQRPFPTPPRDRATWREDGRGCWDAFVDTRVRIRFRVMFFVVALGVVS